MAAARKNLNKSGQGLDFASGNSDQWGDSGSGGGDNWGDTGGDTGSTFGADSTWGETGATDGWGDTTDSSKKEGDKGKKKSGGGGSGGGDTWGDSGGGGGGGDTWGDSGGGDAWGNSGGGDDWGGDDTWARNSGGRSRAPTTKTIIYDAKVGRDKRLRHVFYNLVNPEYATKYNRECPKGMDEDLWKQSMKDNPDPTRLAPLQVCGFKDLDDRMGQQTEETAAQATTVLQLNEKIRRLRVTHEGTLVEMQKFKRLALEQGTRLLAILTKIEILQARGMPIRSDEEAFKMKLEGLQRELNKPDKLRYQLRELEALVSMQDDFQPDNHPTLDDQSVEQITKHLKAQQAGIAQLRDLLKEDLSDLRLMLEALNEMHASKRR